MTTVSYELDERRPVSERSQIIAKASIALTNRGVLDPVDEIKDVTAKKCDTRHFEKVVFTVE
jgi:hypothetical protein